jgi:hypothetical protein
VVGARHVLAVTAATMLIDANSERANHAVFVLVITDPPCALSGFTDEMKDLSIPTGIGQR